VGTREGTRACIGALSEGPGRRRLPVQKAAPMRWCGRASMEAAAEAGAELREGAVPGPALDGGTPLSRVCVAARGWRTD